jgi:hypothetical protein
VKLGTYRATVRLATASGDKRVTFTLRLMESFEQSRLVFNPLLSSCRERTTRIGR